MNSISMNNVSILVGAVLVTLGAITAQVMLATPATLLVMLG
jgi:hypothetical protein